MIIGKDMGPAIDLRNAANARKVPDDAQFLFLVEVVANIVIVDSALLGSVWVLDE